jgi:hypothetical protein
MNNPDIDARICAAKAYLDQLIEKQRSVYAELKVLKPDVTHEELLATMIGMMVAMPPVGTDELMSLAAVAVLAVDRLATQPPPQI